MGRCGWGVGVALVLALLGASCGGTGGGPSDSGHQFVFDARGRLILTVQTVSTGTDQGCPSTGNDPRRLLLTATLLDPQGVPFRNQLITFTAEFPDATFIPSNKNATSGANNQGSILTDDNGQAIITLVAGLKVGRMRVTADAPPALNISTGITVTLTEQGFVSQGDLGIIPTSVTFVNPAPHPSGGPADFTFQATGGEPPYKFSNANPSVGKIETTGTCGSQGHYTLTAPVPTTEGAALKDTVTVQDEKGTQAQADVQVLFVTCTLNASPSTITFNNAKGGESAQITVPEAVPPITVTQTFPAAGTVVVDNNARTITFTVATPPFPVAPDTLLIRDARGCVATVDVTVTTSQPVIIPASATLSPGQSQVFIVSGGVPPYRITPNGGTVNSTIVTEAGGTFIYTAGTVEGTFSIAATDALNAVAQAAVTIKAADLQIAPDTVTLTPGQMQEFVVTGGAPPYRITPSGGTVNTRVVTEAGGSFVYTAGPVEGTFFIIVTDARNALVQATVTIQVATLQILPPTVTLTSGQRQQFIVLGGAPPYHVSPGGGTVDTAVVTQAGGSFIYTAGKTEGTFFITVTDSGGAVAEATVTIKAADLTVEPTTLSFCSPTGAETARISILGGNPPFTATHTFNVAGKLICEQTSGTGNTITCPGNSILYRPAATSSHIIDAVLIRDSDARSATVSVEINGTDCPTAPVVTTIRLTANPTTINGITGQPPSTITAFVFDANNRPIPGISVVFTTDKGSVSPFIATTNANGQATTILTIPAGTPAGVATVTGFVGTVSGSVDVDIVTTSSGTAGPPADIFIDLFANRAGDNNDGTCTTIVSALVVDADGNPVNNGTQVDWAVTGGASVTSPSFTDQQPPCDLSSYLRDSGIDTITSQPGDALTCLKYPQRASGGVVTVTATAQGASGPVHGRLRLNLPPCPSVATVVLTANPDQITGGTGGKSDITATALNANNQPLRNVSILFEVTAGTGTLSSTTATTDSNGKTPPVTLTVAKRPSGSAETTTTVTGTAPGGASGKVDITITAVP
jgi:hypothetical protein